MQPGAGTASAAACPTPQALSAFYLGKLAAAQLQDMAAHLDCCPDCQAAMRALDGAGDELLIGLRDGSPEPFADEPECGAAVRRLQELTPEPAPAGNGEPAVPGRLGP